MMEFPNFPLDASRSFSQLARKMNCLDFHSLCAHVQKLPYGRNANRRDLALVLREGKGSCSSKHAFLKAVADENGVESLALILGVYRMRQSNTPGIGNELEQAGLDWIPEAHCYLKYADKRIDLTQAGSSFALIEADLLEEVEIVPGQVAEFKVQYHRSYIANWASKALSGWSLEKAWEVREKCIQHLSQTKELP